MWILISLNKHTPKNIDLRNVTSTSEAWMRLDAKYGNPVNVSATLIQDFINLTLKSRTEASKVVELRDEVMNLYNDLRATKEDSQLTSNTYLLNQIVYKMPRKYQETFSHQERREYD